jgi:hypothetical protein
LPAPASAVDDAVCEMLTVTVHGKALVAVHAPLMTTVPAATPVPVTDVPT